MCSNLAEARRRQGLTQIDLANQAKVSLSTVGRLERGRSGVAIRALLSTFKVLGMLSVVTNAMESIAKSDGEVEQNGLVCKRARKSKKVEDTAGLICNSPPSLACPQSTDGCARGVDVQVETTVSEPSLSVVVVQVQEVRQAATSDVESTAPAVEIRHPAAACLKLNHTRPSQRKEPEAASKCDFSTKADDEPDGFALVVIQRARERGLEFPELKGFKPGSTDNRSAVLDISRHGASRTRPYSASSPDVQKHKWLLPHHFDLGAIGVAIAALELRQEDERQLKMLMYCATALGGSQPKCTYYQEDGRLGVAKFPSVLDTYPINTVERRTMLIAKAAGIEVLDLSFMHPISAPYLLSTRFDRSEDGGRIHVMSAQSLLMPQAEEEVDYFRLLAAMRSLCPNFLVDARQLWLRLVFDQLTKEIGTGLRKIWFLQVAKDHLKLAPAHGLRADRPKPGALACSATLNWQGNPTIARLLEDSHAFGINRADAAKDFNNLLAALADGSSPHKRWPFS